MQELIEFLRGCPEGFDSGCGLCSNVDLFLYKCKGVPKFADLDEFKKAMKVVTIDWQYYSGNREYPIQSDNGYSTGRCFMQAATFNTMYEGEYGRRRIELANLIADELER